ncbi:MAG: hypothetical protein IAF02_09865 [Anaerolineae bacterium]|nr:hypothetical protein [Anaerolineae bacterium]
MESQERIELDVIITGPIGITNRELAKLRTELFTEMEEDLSSEDVEMYQVAASRSVDPVTIGTISLVLLPIVIGKVADSLIKFFVPSKDSSVTLSVLIGDPPKEQILTYDPRTTSPDEVKSWIDTIEQLVQVENTPDDDKKS